MIRLRSKIWSLSMRQSSIGFAVLAIFLLGDSALAISLGSRSSEIRREIARTATRIDSLRVIRDGLERRLLVRDAFVDASGGRIPLGEATLLANEIERNARLYRFDPLLILAVVLTESRGDFQAAGRFRSGAASGAVGVMQVKPSTARATAKQMGLDVPETGDLLDPAFNLSVGVAYLLQMIHKYGDLRLGIMAYNVGETVLESGLRGEVQLPEAYYRKVFGTYRKLLERVRKRETTESGTQGAVDFYAFPHTAHGSMPWPAYV